MVSFRISPGCTGGSFARCLTVVFRDFDIIGVAFFPSEAYSVLIINANTVLTFTIPG